MSATARCPATPAPVLLTYALCAISESATNRQPKAWPIGKRVGGAVVAALVLFGAHGAHADAGTD